MAKPAGGKSRRGGKKNRKHGRNKKFCERYFKEGRRESNKGRKLIRHIKKFPNDQEAVRVLDEGRSLSYSRGVLSG